MEMVPVESSNAFYVYGLFRDEAMTDPFYIGKGYDRRINSHERVSEKAKRHNIRKNYTIDKLVKEIGFVPKKIISGDLSETEAFSLEIKLIAQYGRLDLGTGCLTNLSEGGTGASPSEETRAKIRAKRALQVCTAETRAKMSAAAKGRKHTAESRAKMSAAQKGHPPNPPESRARQAAAVRGRKHTDEARASMSRTRKGRKLSAAHAEAIARGLKGIKKSDEARARMSAANRGKILSPEHRAAISAGLKRYAESIICLMSQ